jgi:hypothetical protein
MNTKYFAIVAAMTAVLVGATALATADSAFAGGKDKNQATSQSNACGNDYFATNVGCQNVGSQVQGDENVVSQAASQAFPFVDLSPP